MVEFIETREAAKVQNSLQGKAMLETALKNAALSDPEKRNVQHQAQSNGIAAALGALAALLSLPKPPPKAALDPATADLTEEERLARLKQSGQYQAYQERMQAWRQEQQRQQAAAAYPAYRQGEWAEPLLPKTPIATPGQTPQPAPPPTPSPSRTPMPNEIYRPPSHLPAFPPQGYPDPNSIPQIPLALARGGSLDIPHPTSVIGLNLVQWGSTFSASTSVPARSLAELHEEMAGVPPSVERSVKLGPLSLNARRNQYGLTDYEIGLSLGTKQVNTPSGVTVEFSRSFAFRGESWGAGAGIVSAIAASFAAGYLMRKGVTRFFG